MGKSSLVPRMQQALSLNDLRAFLISHRESLDAANDVTILISGECSDARPRGFERVFSHRAFVYAVSQKGRITEVAFAIDHDQSSELEAIQRLRDHAEKLGADVSICQRKPPRKPFASAVASLVQSSSIPNIITVATALGALGSFIWAQWHAAPQPPIVTAPPQETTVPLPSNQPGAGQASAVIPFTPSPAIATARPSEPTRPLERGTVPDGVAAAGRPTPEQQQMATVAPARRDESAGKAVRTPERTLVDVRNLLDRLDNLHDAARADRLSRLLDEELFIAPISVDDAIALLGDIPAPALRRRSIEQLLRVIASPLSEADLMQLLAGFSGNSRGYVVEKLAPCSARPFDNAQIERVLDGVQPPLRTVQARALRNPTLAQPCPSAQR